MNLNRAKKSSFISLDNSFSPLPKSAYFSHSLQTSETSSSPLSISWLFCLLIHWENISNRRGFPHAPTTLQRIFMTCLVWPTSYLKRQIIVLVSPQCHLFQIKHRIPFHSWVYLTFCQILKINILGFLEVCIKHWPVNDFCNVIIISSIDKTLAYINSFNSFLFQWRGIEWSGIILGIGKRKFFQNHNKVWLNKLIISSGKLSIFSFLFL